MLLLIYSLCFVGVGCLLVWYLLTHDHGKDEPVGALWAAFGVGVGGSIVAGILESVLLPKASLTSPQTEALLPLLLAMLGVGVIEESCKFLPAALLLYKRPYFNRIVDGVIFFAVAGLGFGIPENILYTVGYGGNVGVMRIIMVPIFHACTTAMVGYFLARSKVLHEPKTKTVLVLIAAMLIHGLYDFGLSSNTVLFAVMALMLNVFMTAMLFILFKLANEADEALGLTAPTAKRYCPHCGAHNPQMLTYCIRCGSLLKLNTVHAHNP